MKPLRLFANTGHQFFTIDLEELLGHRRDAHGVPVAPPPKEELVRFVHLQQPVALPPGRREKYAGWMQWEGLPWLLYHYSLIYDPDREEERPALHLAIESNLGEAGRGTVLHYESARPSGAASRRESSDASPYVATDADALDRDYPEGSMWLEDPFGGGEVRLPSCLEPGDGHTFDYMLPPETVRVEWLRSSGDTPVEVDLIVDLGNTRTVALLLEDHGAFAPAGEFGLRARPVRFLPRGLSFASRDARENTDEYSMIDSWVLVHRSPFANLEPPASRGKIRAVAGPLGTKAMLLDQRFVSLSPVLVGGGRAPTGAARTLGRAVLTEDQLSPQFYLSSPKRYAWDDLSIGRVAQHWEQIPNEHDADTGQFRPLAGLIRKLMHPGGEDLDLPTVTLDGAPDLPARDLASLPATYPRRDTVCWFAMAIIEAAYRQMNAVDYLEGQPKPKVVRRLRHIRVTYPAGWPFEERDAYLGQWRRATRLFALAHLARPLPRTDGGDAPVLVTRHLDEAVGSQLPILFSELRNLGHDAELWFDLYGAGGDVTVMNIDIGGGTTDIAVIRYPRPSKAAAAGFLGDRRALLQPRLLHRDGHTIAGDVLVKRLIEEVVLPGWLHAFGGPGFADNPEARSLLVNLLKNPRQNPVNSILPDATARLGRVMRLAFVPLANEILRRLTLAEAEGAPGIRPISTGTVADRTAIRELNSLALRLIVRRCDHWRGLGAVELRRLGNPGLFRQWLDAQWEGDGLANLPFRPDAKIEATVERLNRIVTGVLGGMIGSLANLVAEHECNLVIVSGKPSELPQVRRLVVRELPVPAQRILQVKDFAAGEWYPTEFLDDGRIRDAKTVTVTGAALFQDVLNGNLTGLHLADETPDLTVARYNWGLCNGSGNGRDFDTRVFFNAGTPAGKRWYTKLPLRTWIARSLRADGDVHPEPVYRLELTPEAAATGLLPADFNPAEASVDLTLELRLRADTGEGLDIVPDSLKLRFRGVPLAGDARRLVRLRLCTLMEDTFWLDAPYFEIDGSTLFAAGAPAAAPPPPT